MPYSNFSLSRVKKEFGITTYEAKDIFAAVPELPCTQHLTDTLNYHVPIALASNSEKARSEMIITPILMELRKQLNEQINLFSGVEFNVDNSRELNGVCDFIVTKSDEKLFISAPVITLVEAKKENLNAGLGQCIAEMLAAQIFNQQEGQENITIYGSVTSGTNWKFLCL